MYLIVNKIDLTNVIHDLSFGGTLLNSKASIKAVHVVRVSDGEYSLSTVS